MVFVPYLPSPLRERSTLSIPLRRIVEARLALNLFADSLIIEVSERRYDFILYKWLPLPFLHYRKMSREWVEAINTLIETPERVPTRPVANVESTDKKKPRKRLFFGIIVCSVSILLACLQFTGVSMDIIGIGLATFFLTMLVSWVLFVAE